LRHTALRRTKQSLGCGKAGNRVLSTPAGSAEGGKNKSHSPCKQTTTTLLFFIAQLEAASKQEPHVLEDWSQGCQTRVEELKFKELGTSVEPPLCTCGSSPPPTSTRGNMDVFKKPTLASTIRRSGPSIVPVLYPNSIYHMNNHNYFHFMGIACWPKSFTNRLDRLDV